MEYLLSIDWKEVFGLSAPVAETIVRGSVMYWFLFLIFRFVVHRDIGAVGISDLLILVIVADAAQNGMAGETTSVTDGMLLVGTLIAWNVAFDWLSFRFPGFRRFAEPRPLALVQDGRMLPFNMRKEMITEEELLSKLRQKGVDSLEDVKVARIEADGAVSVIMKKR